MIAGHFGLAAGVKAARTDVPLWSMMLATAWLDILFVPLLLVGAESIDDAAGTDGSYGEIIIRADYTHSLVGAVALAIAFGVVAARVWRLRGGLILGGIVFSHWLLDLIVHRADMAILPGNLGDYPRLGLGLWSRPELAIVVEVGILAIGTLAYWRAARNVEARATSRTTRFGMRRSDLVAGLLLGFGVITMTLDVLGI